MAIGRPSPKSNKQLNRQSNKIQINKYEWTNGYNTSSTEQTWPSLTHILSTISFRVRVPVLSLSSNKGKMKSSQEKENQVKFLKKNPKRWLTKNFSLDHDHNVMWSEIELIKTWKGEWQGPAPHWYQMCGTALAGKILIWSWNSCSFGEIQIQIQKSTIQIQN